MGVQDKYGFVFETLLNLIEHVRLISVIENSAHIAITVANQ